MSDFEKHMEVWWKGKCHELLHMIYHASVYGVLPALFPYIQGLKILQIKDPI